MARTKGLLSSAIYDVSQRKPLDARMLVTKRVDLITPNIWIPTDMDKQMSFNGMITAVNGDGLYNGIYYLADRTLITDENYAAYLSALDSGSDTEIYFSMWIKLGELNDIEALAERVLALEQADTPSGVDEAYVSAQISALRQEIINANYLTEDDLSDYATDTDLQSAISEAKTYTDTQLNDYVDTETFTSEVSKLVTDTELSDAINSIPLESKVDVTTYESDKATFVTGEQLENKGYSTFSGSYNDLTDAPELSNFATKDDISSHITMADVVALNYLTTVPSEYITEQELVQKEYVTQSNLDGLATEQYVKDSINAIPDPDLKDYALKSELEELATKEDVDSQLASKANASNTLSGYGIIDAYTKTQVDDKLTELATGGNINLDGYVSEDEWNERVVSFALSSDIEAIETNLSTKADSSYVNEQLKATNESVAEVIAAITYGTF